MMSTEKAVGEELEEAFNMSKLELLVRLGLMPLQSLPILRRALGRIQSGTMLTPDDRQVISILLNKIMKMSFEDSAIFQRMRTIVTQTRTPTMAKKVYERVDANLKLTPGGMLATMATNVQSKIRAGGKISPEEKRLASRAKSELRRRRDNMRENYENAFLSAMTEYGITNIADLPSENVKDFFNKVDQLYNSGE